MVSKNVQQLLNMLAWLNSDERESLSVFLFNEPARAGTFFAFLAKQIKINLARKGNSDASFGPFSIALLTDRVAIKNKPLSVTEAPRNHRWTMHPTDAYAWRINGRTFHSTTEKYALKVPKIREDGSLEDLEYEAFMDACFSKWKQEFSLKSEFPDNPAFVCCKLSKAQWREMKASGRHGGFRVPQSCSKALLYEAPEGYDVHLHRAQTLHQFIEGSHRALHDAGVLAAELGLFSESPADMYHNYHSHRRYFWNVDIVRAMAVSQYMILYLILYTIVCIY
jgi:hypothetical protein